MPKEVGKSICVYIECEGQLGGDRQDDRPDDALEDIPIEFVSIFEKQGNGTQKNEWDDIFTQLLKWGESDSFYKAGREEVPMENGYEKEQKAQPVTKKQEIDFQFTSEEQGGNEEGEALGISGCDPELGRPIGFVFLKDTHTLVSQGMDQVKSANKQIGNPDEEEIVVLKKSAWIPGDHKDAACNDNREYFREAVEKEVIVETGQI